MKGERPPLHNLTHHTPRNEYKKIKKDKKKKKKKTIKKMDKKSKNIYIFFFLGLNGDILKLNPFFYIIQAGQTH